MKYVTIEQLPNTYKHPLFKGSKLETYLSFGGIPLSAIDERIAKMEQVASLPRHEVGSLTSKERSFLAALKEDRAKIV